MDVHHHDTGAEATGVAAWMMAMFLFIIGIVLLVALLIWSPWNDDDGSGTAPGQESAPEQQAPAGTDTGESDTDVDVDGDINVDGSQ